VISFGARSIWLSIGVAHGLVLAALLVRRPTNRTANRCLALLVALVAVRVVPYIIGFAGFYDRWPWLSFLPHDWSLAYGAVIWLYAEVIGTGVLPRRWAWHLAPGAAQGAYYCSIFPRTLAFKDAWNARVHEPWVVPVETAWAFVSLGVYLAVAWRAYTRYQRWLDTELSNREEFRLQWLRLFLVACSATLVLWMATTAVGATAGGLTYFDRFPLYIWFSLLVYGLALGGLRHAGLAYPRPAASVEAVPAPEDTPAPARQPDWAAMGTRWEAEVRANGWWRDPELTAPRLARHLATNTTYLSRALNDGLGRNFNEFINRLRVEAVQAELRTPGAGRDLLVVGLDAGFNSKASFNRVFKRLTGVTPGEFRAATSQIR
jgi:AraC-like DNA-binding protein